MDCTEALLDNLFEAWRSGLSRRILEENMDSILQYGIEVKLSNHSVDQTVNRFLELLRTKGIMLFAIIDHSGEASKAGMTMLPTQLIIFGNPVAGTPLMQAKPSVALDLPLKVLISEDIEGKVWLSYNSPQYLQSRHGLPAQLTQNIRVVGQLVQLAAE